MQENISEDLLFRTALQQVLVERGIKQKDFAERVGIKPPTLNGILKGTSRGSAKNRQAIAEALQMHSEELLDLGRDLLGVPRRRPPVPVLEDTFEVIPKVRAKLSGGGGSFETESDISGYYAFRKDFLQRKGASGAMVLFEVAGNSMSPVLEHGDTVLVDQSQNDVISGHIYAVGVDDSVIVKRLEARPGMLILHSENPESSDFEIKINEYSNVRIIGRVVWSAREY